MTKSSKRGNKIKFSFGKGSVVEVKSAMDAHLIADGLVVSLTSMSPGSEETKGMTRKLHVDVGSVLTPRSSGRVRKITPKMQNSGLVKIPGATNHIEDSPPKNVPPIVLPEHAPSSPAPSPTSEAFHVFPRSFLSGSSSALHGSVTIWTPSFQKISEAEQQRIVAEEPVATDEVV